MDAGSINSGELLSLLQSHCSECSYVTVCIRCGVTPDSLRFYVSNPGFFVSCLWKVPGSAGEQRYLNICFLPMSCRWCGSKARHPLPKRGGTSGTLHLCLASSPFCLPLPLSSESASLTNPCREALSQHLPGEIRPKALIVYFLHL